MKRLLAVIVFCLASFGLSAQSGYTPIKVEAKHNTVHKKWIARDTRIIDNINGYKPIKRVKNRNKYGSDSGVRYDATGFFHTIKDGNRWWFVDPDGYRHFNLAVTCVSRGKGEINKVAFESKFSGNTEIWIDKTAKLLHSLNFNGIGCWSEYNTIINYNKANADSFQLNYSVILNLMSRYGRKRGSTYQLPGHTGYPNHCIFVFDKAFEEFCDKEVARSVAKYKNDPNLLGYFSDNELPFSRKNLENYLNLPEGDEGRIAAEKWLIERNITREQITNEVRNEFAGYVAERYYAIVSAAIRRHDPNHLYLGSRLYGSNKFIEEVIKAAGRYCDVVSINYYSHWTPSKKYLKNWELWAGKPFIITEFYTKAMDSGLTNKRGAGMTVKTQKDRGYAYQHFTLGLLESGNCVGWHWFRYLDNDPTDKTADPSNRDANKGIVDNNYICYKNLAKAMKQMNCNVHPLAKFFDKERQ